MQINRILLILNFYIKLYIERIINSTRIVPLSKLKIMKNLQSILIALSAALLLFSCASNQFIMTDEEISTKGYTIQNWDILKNGVVVARLSSTEWELYRNHLTREISVVTSFSSDEDMKEVLRFVHTKFPNDKIEINEDDGNSFPKN
jgi:hypothetical protein